MNNRQKELDMPGLTRLGATSLLLVAAFFASAAAADHGIAVGKKAPDFQLRDQRGKEVTLSELLKEKPVVVVFHRSADW